MTELDRLGWVVESSYALGGMGFGVRSTSMEFGRWLERALGEYRVEPHASPHYSVVVADSGAAGSLIKERYHALYKGTITIARTLDIRTLVQTFLSDVESFLFAERADAIYADVVPVSLGDKTALAPASLIPYIGTLGSRRVARSGLSFPAETSVEVDLTGRVVPMRRLVRMAEGSWDALAEVVPGNGTDNKTLVEKPLDVDIVLSLGPSEENLAPVSRGLALYRLASHVINIEGLGVKAVEGLRPLVAGAQCFELGSGKAAAKLEAVLTALRST